MDRDLTISEATGADDIAEVRDLLRDYLRWHHDRYKAYRDLIDRHFDHVGLQRDIDTLPGDYAPPRGRLLIARLGDRAAGCVALRDIGQGEAEMRRLFVREWAQGRGLGLALATRIMAMAREGGFHRMRLDTGPLQAEAIAMYGKLGFHPAPPHYPPPQDLAGVLVFMARDL